ncbi:MAG TPA: bifunctional transaldolase/phosoglucose isomerase [Candidatus Saccharimonadales bacterium]|nr:bifunctional transaldolase/phosoglucose isomerase [Candidatus Saccharimonadales bacterium]
MTAPLQQLGEHGQSVWLDFISRELVTTGQLERRVAEEHVTGLTSNPTIFQKAIAEGSLYDDQIRELIESGIDDPMDVFTELAISDIQHAADILRPVHERTAGADGYVSLEVPPALSHDTGATIATARTLWERVDRPNLMIKIPATLEGMPAIHRTIADGRNVNVTLIFAIAMHERVIEQYISALEARHRDGQPLDVHSVASFFVSRVDTLVDKLLEEKLAADPGNALIEGLLGKAAIANAVLAYELFERRFNDQRFDALRAAGAHVQRPLWASTSAKNPHYRDVLYAEALIGPDTVDTMPPATIEAFMDHGVVAGDTVKADYAGAHRVMDQLAEAGIDMDGVTQKLLDDGVKQFADSYDQLIRGIAEKIDAMGSGYSRRQRIDTGTAAVPLDTPGASDIATRIWHRDPDLWKPGDSAHAAVIDNRLGWLDVVGGMRERLPELEALATEVREAGWRDCVLLGMGGSSLCPEVVRSSFGSAEGQPALHVLDTTDPLAIARVTGAIDPTTTGYIVSSKSGTTLETLSHLAHFWEMTAGVSHNPGSHFIAVTDPGTPLATIAQDRAFLHLFRNPPDIGGRYSALSMFGLVPAAIIGVDCDLLLERAARMRRNCTAGVPGDLNCGLSLGTVMGVLHDQGRDKVTILAPQAIESFSLWAEQLIAESTGKEGKGIIPIGDEPLGDPAVYAQDRLFVALRIGDDAAFDRSVEALKGAGHPVIAFDLADKYDLAAEFFRWEFATAVAGAHLSIDPFDEPNVQESKDNTRAVLQQYQQSGALPDESAAVTDGALRVYGDVSGTSASGALAAHLDRANPGDYVALMAYVTPDDVNERALQRLRVAIRDTRRLATTLGFGPRFLHSTGQLHKGGPNTGVYIQITADDGTDVAIPGQPFTFSVLKRAQAAGDLQSLRSHGRRVVRVHIAGDLDAGLASLTDAVSATTAAR